MFSISTLKSKIKVGALLLMVFLLPLLGCGQKEAPANTTSRESTGQQGVSGRPAKRVLALYYPWYQSKSHSGQWAHQTGVDTDHHRIADHTHYPADGPYDSADPTLIDRHLKEVQEAGIDTLVCSWWGPGDYSDKAIRLLLERAAKTPVTICVLWERLTPNNQNNAPEQNMSYILQNFGKQPAYFRHEGKPVVFAFKDVCTHLNQGSWVEFRERIQDRYPPGLVLVGEGTDQVRGLQWNGAYTLGVTPTMFDADGKRVTQMKTSTDEQAITIAENMDKISIITVFPGYDDLKPNQTLHLPGFIRVPRDHGKLYDALWHEAIDLRPDWVLINSFNQWHAGTEIEPSLELGDAYLKQTQKYALQFKGNTK